MLKRFVVMGIALALVFGGVIGFKLYKRAAIREHLANMGEQAVHLNAVVAEMAAWQQHLTAVGSLRAQQGIEIRSEVDGVIRRVHVEPGQSVKAGDLLVELDDTVDQATLKSARVRLEKARRDFERDRALFERALISEDKFENSRSEFESFEALVEETQGIIDRKTLRASFAGTVGIHNLADGHYLGKGDDVVALQALETLYLDLNLPEKQLERLRAGQRVIFSVPSHGDRQFTGEVRFIDVQVQATTRNVLVRAVVDNASGDLLPGMFASATIILNETDQVVVVPRVAVAFSLFGETVYRLEKEADAGQDKRVWRAHLQTVTSGEVREGLIEVEGLSAGQIIALDTQNRLLEGTPVVIENLPALEAAGVGAD